eukprot:scaffold18201_cov61-Phaeocystis_antarctica.AAC.1
MVALAPAHAGGASGSGRNHCCLLGRMRMTSTAVCRSYFPLEHIFFLSFSRDGSSLPDWEERRGLKCRKGVADSEQREIVKSQSAVLAPPVREPNA